MSWHDTDGLWMRVATRRVHSVKVMALLELALVGVVLVLLAWLSRDSTKLLTHYWIPLAVVASAAFALGAIAMHRQATRMKRIRHLVPLTDGAVCPMCCVELQSSEDTSTCPRCQRHFAIEALRQYWTEFLLTPHAALNTLSVLSAGQSSTSFKALLETLRFYVNNRMWAWPFFMVGLWVLGGVSLSPLVNIGMLSALLQLMPMMMIMSGVSWFGIGWNRRTTTGQHCAQCNYQRAPTGMDPTRCPECGAAWSNAGGTVTGRRARDARVLVASITLFTFGIAIMISDVAGRNVVVAVLPTRMLIMDAASGGGRSTWDKLRARTLTPREDSLLAEKMLAFRDGGGYLDAAARRWITDALAGDTLSEELRERWFEGMLSLQVVVPAEVEVGSVIAVDVAVVHRGTIDSLAANGLEHFALVAGFYVNGSTKPIARRERRDYPGLLDDDEYWPRTTVQATHAGPLSIRFVLWSFVHAGGRGSYSISWNDDGSPQLPAQTLWARRLEATAIVQVEESAPR